MNESISTSAGAAHGQLATPATLRRIARYAGRVPAERNTRYGVLRTFGDEDGNDALDEIVDSEAVFGSYAALTRDARFRFRKEAMPAGMATSKQRRSLV